MKLYPMERVGKISNYANTTHFKGVKTFNCEKGGIAFNKAERQVMKKIGWNLEKDDMEFGSLWLDKGDIQNIIGDLENLTDINYSEAEIVGELLAFLDICLNRKYNVRVY